jgi:Zn-dependent protease
MLILALLLSIFGFIFAAPGAVMIRGHLTKRQNGTISAAGPGMNMVIAGLFLALMFTTGGIAYTICRYGFIINSWLAVFNLIPFAMFDGKKIYDWHKGIYFVMLAIGLGLIVIQNLVMLGRI